MLCRNAFVTALFLGLLVILAPSQALSLSVPREGILEISTEKRFPDPVLIKGNSLPAMTGGPLGNYRVYACQADQFLPIRFQIDEMTKEGDLIFPYGKLSNIKESNGSLDEGDILLFMAKDAGDRVSQAYWPENASKGLELEIIDPVNNASSWVYLFLFEKNPPPLCFLPDYFSYDYETESLGSQYWKQQYHVDEKGHHTNYYNYFSVLPKGGGNGETARRVVDRHHLPRGDVLAQRHQFRTGRRLDRRVGGKRARDNQKTHNKKLVNGCIHPYHKPLLCLHGF